MTAHQMRIIWEIRKNSKAPVLIGRTERMAAREKAVSATTPHRIQVLSKEKIVGSLVHVE